MNDNKLANDLHPMKMTLNSAVAFQTPLTTDKMLVVLTFILIINYSSCFNENSVLYKEIFNYHNETDNKAEFAHEVVDIIYNSFRQWFFTVTFCEFTYFENRILKYTENYGYGYNVMLLNGCPNINKTILKPRFNKHGETAYLVTSNDLSIDISERVIDALKSTGIFKPRSAVIFVVNTPVELDKYIHYVLKYHFELLWSRSITNSVLILKSNGILKMYSYNPFFNKVRDITEVKDVSHFLKKQYNNLYGHELRLSVFRKIYVSDETGPVRCDSRFAVTVFKFLNATCIPLSPRDGSTIGDLLDNGTATGVTADLIDGYSDLELSSRILKNSFYGYIDTTYPLTQDELCFLVQKADKQSAFTTTIRLITLDILTIFMFTFIFFIIITIFVRKMETHILKIGDMQTVGATIMNLIKCFIRQTVDFTFIGPTFRCLVLLIILYSLIIDCVIDGIITTAITYPRYKPDINTMPELVNSKLVWGIHNRDFRIFNKSLPDEVYEKIKNRMEIFDDKKIKAVIGNRDFKYATLLRKTDSQYLSRKLVNMYKGRPLFYTVPDCPLPCFIVYGLRYGSPYLPRLNYILHNLIQAGIIQYWSQTEQSSLDRNLIQNKERKPLGFENLQEMFYVLLIGEAISIVVFILEIVWNKCNKRY